MSTLTSFMEKLAIGVKPQLAGTTPTGRLAQVDHGDAGLHQFLDVLVARHGVAGADIANKYRKMLPDLSRKYVNDPKGYQKAHHEVATNALREVVQKRHAAHQSGDAASIRSFYDQGALQHGDNYKSVLHNPGASKFDNFMRSGTGKVVVGGTALLGAGLLAHHFMKKRKEREKEAAETNSAQQYRVMKLLAERGRSGETRTIAPSISLKAVRMNRSSEYPKSIIRDDSNPISEHDRLNTISDAMNEGKRLSGRDLLTLNDYNQALSGVRGNIRKNVLGIKPRRK